MTDFWGRFEATAARLPDRAALVVEADTPRTLTYRQLHAAAEGFARRLVALGIGAGDACAILGENSPEWVIAALALHRLNAVAVPLDRTHSPETLARLLADAGARGIAVSAAMAETAAEAIAGLDCLLVPLIGEDASADLPAHVEALAATAMILYTSGTSGDPKGVVLTHANIAAAIDAMVGRLAIRDSDSTLGMLPLFHILAQVSTLFLPFSTGALLVQLEEISASEVVRALKARRITILCSVPQFFYLIHDRIQGEIGRMGGAGRTAARTMLALSGTARERAGINLGRMLFRRVHQSLGGELRLLVSAGAAFDPSIARSLDRFGFNILQAYGLTETTGAVTLNLPGDNRIGTVGPAMDGAEVVVLAPDGTQLPTGEEGEVAIKGAMVSPGYHRRPDLTAAVRRDGWFLSGDRGVLDPAGHLAITGRDKDMIVLESGKKVYPEEIERALDRSAYIAESCVLGRKTVRGGISSETLHAVIVPDMAALRRDAIVNVGEQIRYDLAVVSGQLPAHQRVMGFTIAHEPLARTSTRKLRRFLIRDSYGAAADDEAAPVAAAWSDADRAWAETPPAPAVLAIVKAQSPVHPAEVHPDQSIELDLGFDSLRRVELILGIEQALGVTLPEGAGLEAYVVRDLVAAVARAKPAEGGAGGEAWPRLLAPEATGKVAAAPTGPGPLLRPVHRAGLAAMRGAARATMRADVRGLEHLPQPPFILCPNHQSFLDGPLVIASLPRRIARSIVTQGHSDYFGAPRARRLAALINIAVVNPDADLVNAMRISAAALASGRALMLFPEGERTFDGEIGPLRRGAAILAITQQVPIVPLVIDGAWQMWPRERSFQGFAKLRMRVLPPIAPPLPPEGGFDEAAAELTATLDAAMRAEFSTLRAARG